MLCLTTVEWTGLLVGYDRKLEAVGFGQIETAELRDLTFEGSMAGSHRRRCQTEGSKEYGE